VGAERKEGQKGITPHTVDTKLIKLLETGLMKMSTATMNEVPCNCRRHGQDSGRFLKVGEPYESTSTSKYDWRACK
jgi:hypothetical protein